MAKKILVGHGVAIVHRDSDLLVADKPSGLISARLEGGSERGTLLEVLRALLGGAGERDTLHQVHRLDRDTSGLIVFARNKSAHEALVEQLRKGDIERVYLALVAGDFKARFGEETTFSAPVAAFNPGRRGRRAPQSAITHVRFVRAVGGRRAVRSLLECRLETGRTHQIRLHLTGAGLPVLGDRLYGTTASGTAVMNAGPQPPRLCLHATRLEFTPPRGGKRWRFHSPWPADLASLVPEQRGNSVESRQ